MNILMIAADYLPHMCGYSTRMYGLTSALSDLGHDITVIVPRINRDWKEMEKFGRIEVIRVHPYRGLYSKNILNYMSERIKTNNYDIIHAHNPPKYGLLSYLGNITHNLPFVYELHHPSIYELPQKPQKRLDTNVIKNNKFIWTWLDRLVLNRSDKILVISNEIRDYLIKNNIPPSRIDLLPNGVDLGAYSFRKKDPQLLEKYNLKSSKIILYLGTFSPWEDLVSLVKVYAKVKEMEKDARLLLVGDGPERAKIEDAIQDHGLENDVIITGFVPFSEAPRYYSICDVFVMTRPDIPLTRDTTPIKPFEAMAAGKVVVSTDLKAMREVIVNGETGFLVPHSIDALADKVVEVLNDATLRETIGSKARKYVEENRSWEAIARNLVKVYEEAINMHK